MEVEEVFDVQGTPDSAFEGPCPTACWVVHQVRCRQGELLAASGSQLAAAAAMTFLTQSVSTPEQ